MPTMNHPREEVLMKSALPLRSRVHRKMQARLCRPVERGNPSAAFIETIQRLPENPEPVLLAKILNQVAGLGRIHASQPSFSFA